MQTTVTIKRENLHVLMRLSFFHFWDMSMAVFDDKKGTAKVKVYHKTLNDRAELKAIEQSLRGVIL